jgi:hypothetical protein
MSDAFKRDIIFDLIMQKAEQQANFETMKILNDEAMKRLSAKLVYEINKESKNEDAHRGNGRASFRSD